MLASASTHYGGGVAVYTKSNLQCEKIKFDTIIRLGHICLQVKQHQAGPKLLFMVFYRPSNSSADFCHSLSKLIDSTLSHYGEIIDAGDFNTDLLRKKNSILSTIFSDAGNKGKLQHLNANRSHLYDTPKSHCAVLCSCAWNERPFSCMLCTQISWAVKSSKCDHDEISYRNLKKLNLDHCIQDLEYAPWSVL